MYDCRYTWLHGHHVLCQMCALRRPGQRYARHTQDAKSNFVRRIVEQKSKSLQKNRRSNPKNPVESEEITDVWQSQHQALEVQQALISPFAFQKVLSVWAAPFFIAHSRSEIKILESADSRIFVVSLKMGWSPAGSAPEEWRYRRRAFPARPG